MNYGVLPQGFIRKPFNVLLDEFQSRARALFGDDIDLSDYSPLGLYIKLCAWSCERQWQLAEDVYYSFDMEAAEGVPLDRLAKLGLVARKNEIKATGYLLFSGAPDSSVSIGTQAETEQGVIFATIAHGVIDEDGSAMIAAECIEPGASGNLPALSINKIKTPVAGVSSVTNPLPFTGGRGIETDAELKKRFLSSHLASGSALNAIVAKVLAIPAVLEVIGYENVENYPDTNGLPAGSIEIIVSEGDEDTIAKTIFKQKPAGVNTAGNVTKLVFDAEEKEHTIRFSRPDYVQVYIEYVLSVNLNFDHLYVEKIKQTAMEFVNAMPIAAALYSWKLCNLLNNVSGLENAKAYLGFSSDNVTFDKLVPLPRELYKTAMDKVVVRYE